MVMTIFALAGLFTACLTSCSSSDGNANDPNTPSQTESQTVGNAAKTVLTCNYHFGDSLLYYVDAKIIYTDGSGKEQTQVVDLTNCTKEDAVPTTRDLYTFEITNTTIPGTTSVRIEITPKDESVLANAKTGAYVTLQQDFLYTIYDKDGKTIFSQKAAPNIDSSTTLNKINASHMKDFLAESLNDQIELKQMDKTLSLTTQLDGKTDYSFKKTTSAQ